MQNTPTLYETKLDESMGNFATICGILNGMIGS
jgi:hypothetical protein